MYSELVQIVLVISSSIILLLKFNKTSLNYDSLDVSGDTPIGNSRFSTLKRDVFKLAFVLIQTGLYAFLFFWDFRNNEGNTRLFHGAVLTFYWVLIEFIMHTYCPATGA